jgi:threonine synthase
MAWRGVIREYAARLPVGDPARAVTILEGGTPLVPAERLARAAGEGVRVFLKTEGANPTGSFKDRGMTVAITKAIEDGARAVICASTGNTSASAAAYAARAGLTAYVLIPEGKIALGKLSQAIVHGARVLQVRGNFDEALALVRWVSENYPVTLVNSLNPYRIEGQKTAAFEIVDTLGRAPDFHFLPVGNAGNITAYWKGYREYAADGRCTPPRMFGWQAAGSAPIVEGRPIASPETVATAIRIGNPASWKQAEAARDESGGAIGAVTDEEILSAYRRLAAEEGVFCEPASAASVAGFLKSAAMGLFRAGDVVVCTLTGHGLKDPDAAIRNAAVKPETLPAEREAIVKGLGL